MSEQFTDFEVQVDLNAVNAWDGEGGTAPPGDYQLKVADVQSTTSKGSSKPMMKVKFEIVALADGTDAGPDATGKFAYNNYMLDNNTGLGRAKQLVIACGGSMDAIRGSELLGQTIVGTIYHEMGEAKVGPDGNALPAKIFANVKGERPLEAPPVAATQTAATTAAAQAKGTPPIMNGKGAAGAKAPATGARRA